MSFDEAEVLDRIRAAGKKLHPRKCHLMRQETHFLSHVLGVNGVATDPVMVQAVHHFHPYLYVHPFTICTDYASLQ